MPRSATKLANYGTSLRLTLAERQLLDKAAAALGLGPSRYIREVVLSAIRPNAAASGAADTRAARARLLAHWTIQIGRLADEVRTLAATPAGELDPAGLETLKATIAQCHVAMVVACEEPR